MDVKRLQGFGLRMSDEVNVGESRLWSWWLRSMVCCTAADVVGSSRQLQAMRVPASRGTLDSPGRLVGDPVFVRAYHSKVLVLQ